MTILIPKGKKQLCGKVVMSMRKNFGILFIYPVLLLGTGFLGGIAFINYFYPGMSQTRQYEQADEIKWQQITGTIGNDQLGENAVEDSAVEEGADTNSDGNHLTGSLEIDKDIVQTSVIRENLNADTSYVLEEKDIRNNTIVETIWKLPAKYIGMNREEFLEAMKIYEASPPLEELERGFVSLEVLSFSPEKVVVQMNYEYVLPGECFYLMVEDNYVVVYLEDQKTVYMDTDILLKELPEELQQQIIQIMYMPDEESLYDFLENYSS